MQHSVIVINDSPAIEPRISDWNNMQMWKEFFDLNHETEKSMVVGRLLNGRETKDQARIDSIMLSRK